MRGPPRTSDFMDAFLSMVIIGMKNCGLMTYILGKRWDTSTMPVL